MQNNPDCSGKSCTGKRTLLLLGILASVLFLIIVPVAAHAPADIVMSYDPGAEKLTVTVTHVVDDPQTHYVKKVQVKKNGLVISDPDYKSQPTKDTFSYTYDVKASHGDTFRVIATCSIAGNLEKVYDITAPKTVATVTTPVSVTTPVTVTTPGTLPATPAPTQKSALGLVPFLGAAALLLMRKE
ncbi:MAG: hypothetical protein M0Q92_05445 [Methanoregula sp.]|jgi:hypothetical protein|nr:hypothetical protein [Methanoregula sp.]